MKAVVVRSYGSPGQLRIADVDSPVPAADEVLVRVRATSVNPYDWHHVSGKPYVARLIPGSLGLRGPKIGVLGCDMAGQVEAVGADVTGFRPGDDVYALLSGGGFAEYVSVKQDLLAAKPANLSHEQAAAVPMAAVTALLGLQDVGGLKSGQRVLVNGASGGVGTFAVQIATALGATVTGVCGAKNSDLVRSLGADEVIDYRTADFTRHAKRHDLLLDIAGSRQAAACRRVLTDKGTLVLVGGPAGRWLQPVGHMIGTFAAAPFVSPRIAMADTVSSGQKKQHLQTLTGLIEDGKVTPVIDRRYPFAEISAAVEYSMAGHAAGKVVVSI